MLFPEVFVSEKSFGSYKVRVTRVAVLNVYIGRVFNNDELVYEVRGRNIKKVFNRLEVDFGITQY